jgi:hypothetical protein
LRPPARPTFIGKQGRGSVTQAGEGKKTVRSRIFRLLSYLDFLFEAANEVTPQVFFLIAEPVGRPLRCKWPLV